MTRADTVTRGAAARAFIFGFSSRLPLRVAALACDQLASRTLVLAPCLAVFVSFNSGLVIRFALLPARHESSRRTRRTPDLQDRRPPRSTSESQLSESAEARNTRGKSTSRPTLSLTSSETMVHRSPTQTGMVSSQTTRPTKSPPAVAAGPPPASWPAILTCRSGSRVWRPAEDRRVLPVALGHLACKILNVRLLLQ